MVTLRTLAPLHMTKPTEIVLVALSSSTQLNISKPSLVVLVAFSSLTILNNAKIEAKWVRLRRSLDHFSILSLRHRTAGHAEKDGEENDADTGVHDW